MDNIYTRMNHVFDTGVITQTPIDIELSNRLRDSYDVTVICSEFSAGKTFDANLQGEFFILLDTEKSQNSTVRAIGKLKEAKCGATLSLPKYGEEFRKFAEIAVCKYLEIANLNRSDYDEMYVTVYGFRAKAINHLYLKTYDLFRNFMYTNFNVQRRDVIGAEDSQYYVLVDFIEDFKRIVQNKNEIYQTAFSMIKKQDFFSCFDFEDLRISFFLKEALDYKLLSDFSIQKPLW